MYSLRLASKDHMEQLVAHVEEQDGPEGDEEDEVVGAELEDVKLLELLQVLDDDFARELGLALGSHAESEGHLADGHSGVSWQGQLGEQLQRDLEALRVDVAGVAVLQVLLLQAKEPAHGVGGHGQGSGHHPGGGGDDASVQRPVLVDADAGSVPGAQGEGVVV